MKLLVGGIMHETHSFSREPTTTETLPTFRGDELLNYRGTNTSVGGVIDQCAELGIDVAPTFFVNCVSTGTPSRETFDQLTDELCESIARSLPADGIVLTLHGAMVAEGSDEAEAVIAQRVREVVGNNMPIAVTLDYHANIGPDLIRLADIITVYDTYPHIDAGARARESVSLLVEVINGRSRPAMALAMPPIMPVPQALRTESGLYHELFSQVHQLEEAGEALTISVCGGFAYSDVPQAGSSVLVTTENDETKATKLALQIANQLWDERERVLVQNMTPADAVQEAIGWPDGPVMLVDVGDNIGGGTPGDGTVLLRELLEQGAREATIVMVDAEAAKAATAAGPDGAFSCDVGGKVDEFHGPPVHVIGTVVSLSDGKWIHEGPENAGVPVDMGPSAVVRAGGVNLILTSVKAMPGDLQQLRSMNIEPADQHIIVVKAAVRWRGGYGPIAKHAILVDTPGLGSADLTQFPYQQIRRPIYPLDREAEWDRTIAVSKSYGQRG